MDMPDKIYLQVGYGDEGSHTWSAEKTDWEHEIQYTRTDLAQSLADALEGGPTYGPDFLEWIADRLVNVYGESDNVDFVLSLRLRAKQHRAALANYRKGE